MQLFPQVYRAYEANDEGLPFRETQAWNEFVNGKLTRSGTKLNEEERNSDPKNRAQSWDIFPHKEFQDISPDSRKVKVVGVWDTVGSLGVPDVMWFDNAGRRTKYGFHNVKLNEGKER